jgi:hypothetical protein
MLVGTNAVIGGGDVVFHGSRVSVATWPTSPTATASPTNQRRSTSTNQSTCLTILFQQDAADMPSFMT